jgi:hypothetical protein
VSATGGGARPALGVRLDGVAMNDADARAFWERFSAYMEANKGDLAGFAKQEGLASVHPSMDGRRAVLLASRTAPQKGYVSVERGGSSDPQRSAGQSGANRGRRDKSRS